MANNNATSHGQTVDLAGAKLNDLYGGGNVPRLNGPEKFRRSSKTHLHDNSGSTRHQQLRVQQRRQPCRQSGASVVPSASSRGDSDNLRNGGGDSNWSGAKSRAIQHLRPIRRQRRLQKRTARRVPTSRTSRSRHGHQRVQPRARLSRSRNAERAQHGTTGAAGRDERTYGLVDMNTLGIANLSMMAYRQEAQLLTRRSLLLKQIRPA
jgi:hypothetical protein